MKKLISILIILLQVSINVIAQPSSASHSYVDAPKQIIRVENDFKFVTLKVKTPTSDTALILGYNAAGTLKFRKAVNIIAETVFLNEAIKTPDNCLVGVGQYQQFCDTTQGNGFIYKIDTNGVFQFLYAGLPEPTNLYNKYTSVVFHPDSNAYFAFGKYVYDKFDVNGNLVLQNVATVYKEVYTCLNSNHDVIVSFNSGTNPFRGYLKYFSDTSAFIMPDPDILQPSTNFPQIKKMQFNSQKKIIALGEIFIGNTEGRLYMYDTLLSGFRWNLAGVTMVNDFDIKQDTAYVCLRHIDIYKIAPDSVISYQINNYMGSDELITGISVSQHSITVVGKQCPPFQVNWLEYYNNNSLTNYEIANCGLGRDFSHLNRQSAQVRDWSVANYTTTVIQSVADTTYIQLSYSLNVRIKNASPTWDGDDTIKSVYINHQPIFEKTTSCGKPLYYKHFITGLNILPGQEQYVVTPVVSDIYKKTTSSGSDTISPYYCVWSSAPNNQMRLRNGGNDYSCKAFLMDMVSVRDYLKNDELFLISPNPSSDLFHVSLKTGTPTQNYTIKVIDVFGKTILEKKMDNINTDVNLTNCSVGIYFLSIKQDEKILYTKKIVKQ